MMLGLGFVILEGGLRDFGAGLHDLGAGLCDHGVGLCDFGAGLRDLGAGLRDYGAGLRSSEASQGSNAYFSFFRSTKGVSLEVVESRTEFDKTHTVQLIFFEPM